MSDLLTSDAYYLPGEIAAYLRVSPATLEYWRRVGGGPAYVRLKNRHIRYQGADVLQWMAARRRRTTTDTPALRVVGEGRSRDD